MKELIRSNDVVFLTYLESQLKQAEIEVFILDSHTSIMEGSLGFLPQRVMVDDDDHPKALGILNEVRRKDEQHGTQRL